MRTRPKRPIVYEINTWVWLRELGTREKAEEPFRSGEWRLCPVEGWPDNRSCENPIVWGRHLLTCAPC